VVLQTEVTDLTMRIWVGGGWHAGADALVQTSGSIASSAIPTGLEVTIQLRGRDNGILKIFLLGAV
jgi:hypothetical protein